MTAVAKLPEKFRKKPVVIEAVQLDGTVAAFEAAVAFMGGAGGAHNGHLADNDPDKSWLYIDTLEGQMTAKTGDWITKGVKGEFYPCKPDIFAATYEPAALSPAELGGVERDVQRALRALTEHEWISEDGCASLAANDIANTIRKLSTPRAAEAVTEGANKAVADLRWLCRHYDQFVPIGRLNLYLDRLEASLTPPSAKGESSDG